MLPRANRIVRAEAGDVKPAGRGGHRVAPLPYAPPPYMVRRARRRCEAAGRALVSPLRGGCDAAGTLRPCPYPLPAHPTFWKPATKRGPTNNGKLTRGNPTRDESFETTNKAGWKGRGELATSVLKILVIACSWNMRAWSGNMCVFGLAHAQAA